LGLRRPRGRGGTSPPPCVPAPMPHSGLLLLPLPSRFRAPRRPWSCPAARPRAQAASDGGEGGREVSYFRRLDAGADMVQSMSVGFVYLTHSAVRTHLAPFGGVVSAWHVFVPTHPLIKHWVSVLRNEQTTCTIFSEFCQTLESQLRTNGVDE
jgi:hypothetical protein